MNILTAIRREEQKPSPAGVTGAWLPSYARLKPRPAPSTAARTVFSSLETVGDELVRVFIFGAEDCEPSCNQSCRDLRNSPARQ